MYPSNGYVNATFPENDFNPNLEIQDLSSSSCLFRFPSPLNQYEDEAIYLQQFHAILSQNNLDSPGALNEMTVPDITAYPRENNNGPVKESTDQLPEKKKLSKTDRHSKINTAHGPRDRRMRLSLDVARKFFGLQDVLGFDKASKTVEWLLTQSKMAIKELTHELPQTDKGSDYTFTLWASASDGEVVSAGLDEYSVPETASTKTDESPSTHRKNKRTRRVRKPSFYPFARESREKARERARERTKDKKKQQQQQQKQLDDQHSTNLMTWSPIGSSKDLAGSSHNTMTYTSLPSLDEVEEIQNACEESIKNISDPNLLIIAGNWSPSALFNYQHSSEISHEFADFPFHGYHNQIF